MKNLFLHNQIRVNNILAKQNYLWLGDRMGPAMMYSSSRSSLRNIAMYYCPSITIYFDLFESTCINLPESRSNRLFLDHQITLRKSVRTVVHRNRKRHPGFQIR